MLSQLLGYCDQKLKRLNTEIRNIHVWVHQVQRDTIYRLSLNKFLTEAQKGFKNDATYGFRSFGNFTRDLKLTFELQNWHSKEKPRICRCCCSSSNAFFAICTNSFTVLKVWINTMLYRTCNLLVVLNRGNNWKAWLNHTFIYLYHLFRFFLPKLTIKF